MDATEPERRGPQLGRRRTAEISEMKERPMFSPTNYQNTTSAVAFIAVCVVMFSLFGCFVGSGDGLGSKPTKLSIAVGAIFTTATTQCVALGFFLPSVWFLLLCFLTRPIYFFSILVIPVISIAHGVWALTLTDPQMEIGVSSLVVGVILALMTWWLWKKIVFTAMLVSIACKTSLKHLNLFALGVVQLFVVMLWTCICAVAFTGLAAPDQLGPTGSGLVLILPYCWGAAVINNTYIVICASTFARDYFSAPAGLMTSMCNALTYSFGSICFGALLIAIVQTLKYITESLIQSAREDGNVVGLILASCLDCFMDFVEWLAQIFNVYSMAIVGIYHMSFENSAYEAANLISENGMQVFVQDQVVWCVDLVGALLVVTATAWIEYSILPLMPEAGPSQISWIVAAAAGILVAIMWWRLLMLALGALITTLLVCFCEDPKPLPGMSKELAQAFAEKRGLFQEEQEEEAKDV